MPRPSKAIHALAKLRGEMGLTQEEFAQSIGSHRRTVQDIERGKLRLSRRMAMRISEKTGVSVNWLIRGASDQEIENVVGARWSDKDRQAVQERSNRWPGLRFATRRQQLSVCANLFKDYLLVRDLLEQMPTPIEASFRWHKFQKKALLDCIGSYGPCSVKSSEGDSVELKDILKESGITHEALQTIRDDLDAVSDELDSPRDPNIMARLLLAAVKAGTSNPTDMLEAFDELDKHPEPAADGSPFSEVFEMIKAEATAQKIAWPTLVSRLIYSALNVGQTESGSPPADLSVS
jgi:transcriptional regulator with XRE-family HTH domain